MTRFFPLFWVRCAACLLAGLIGVPIATAQSGDEAVRLTDAPANLFATLDAPASAAGVRLEVPPSWRVEAVTLLRYGSERVAAEVQRSGRPGVVDVRADRPLRGPHEVVVRVRTGRTPGRFTWTLTPLQELDRGLVLPSGPRQEQSVRVRRASEAGGNRALDLRDAVAPVRLRVGALPALNRRAAFTLEFWMQTTGLDEVVTSTWSGREPQPYPLELVVDASGRLRAFFGEPGRHQALMSPDPVAGGGWHHVAVAYDAARGVYRLHVDGAPVDSLMNVSLPVPLGPVSLALGGRPVAPDAASPEGSAPGAASPPARFRGRLDEMRLWDVTRTPAAIRASMRAPASGGADGGGGEARVGASDPLGPSGAARVLRLGFDDAPADAVAEWPAGARVEPVGLTLETPLHDVQATTDGRAVTLQWAAAVNDVRAFVVERASDAQAFDEVARLRPSDARGPAPNGERAFAYTGDDVSGQVVFYRIRQIHTDGRERVSGTLKVGLGAPDTTDRPVRLIGNFPNPFTASTTIAYELHETARVDVTVWDVAGHRIAQLTSDVLGPGYYEQPFNASDLPSGTYFVRLDTPSGTHSHRMVVLR